MTTFLNKKGIQAGSKVLVMGILNVTPDSFSDGGLLVSEQNIITRAEEMVRAGVDMLDIGGESTRPFAEKISVDEELRRVMPAVHSLRRHLPSILLSIDTTKAEVARQACDAGANIINDISALRFDPDMLLVARDFSTPIIIMHMQGTPENMQKNPAYGDVVADIISFFQKRLDWLHDNGIPRERVIIDPGIGFGKTVNHNLQILNRLTEFTCFGCPVLVGHSRKSFLKNILDLDVDDRDLATAVISALCITKGASILRVHDVNATLQAVRLTKAIQEA